MPSQALQIILEKQSQRSSQKRAVKKKRIFQIAIRIFFPFFLIFVQLSDLNCSEITILSNHIEI
jgi:hypothetical protein